VILLLIGSALPSRTIPACGLGLGSQHLLGTVGETLSRIERDWRVTIVLIS